MKYTVNISSYDILLYISHRPHTNVRITVRMAEAVGGMSRPLVGTQVQLPESSGISLEISRVPSTMIFTRDFRDLEKNISMRANQLLQNKREIFSSTFSEHQKCRRGFFFVIINIVIHCSVQMEVKDISFYFSQSERQCAHSCYTSLYLKRKEKKDKQTNPSNRLVTLVLCLRDHLQPHSHSRTIRNLDISQHYCFPLALKKNSQCH